MGDEVTISGIRERLLAQEAISWRFGLANQGTAQQTETFSKLRVFRGVQQCEVTYEEITATTSLRLRDRSYELFSAVIAISKACCVWSMKFSSEM
jgi:hypothetical protein